LAIGINDQATGKAIADGLKRFLWTAGGSGNPFTLP
jgi:hypothetical protein